MRQYQIHSKEDNPNAPQRNMTSIPKVIKTIHFWDYHRHFYGIPYIPKSGDARQSETRIIISIVINNKLIACPRAKNGNQPAYKQHKPYLSSTTSSAISGSRSSHRMGFPVPMDHLEEVNAIYTVSRCHVNPWNTPGVLACNTFSAAGRLRTSCICHDRRGD
jgi:hypothetical protein